MLSKNVKRRRYFRFTLSVVLSAALVACASTSQHDATSQTADVPAAWTSQAGGGAVDATSLVRWWERFDDPMLGLLVERHIRSSAGVAVFVGQTADKPHWVDVGRCYERFALQATALGIRNAFLNQPVEVQAVRSPFAAAIGLGGQRPDLVVRFGRGPNLPPYLRRPVQAVLV